MKSTQIINTTVTPIQQQLFSGLHQPGRRTNHGQSITVINLLENYNSNIKRTIYTGISERVVIGNSRYWNRKKLWVHCTMSDNAPAKVVTCMVTGIMVNLHFIFCNVDANSNKLFVLLEPHSSFRFQYRQLTMTTFLKYLYTYI